MSDDPKDGPSTRAVVGIVAGLGLEFVVVVSVALFAGSRIDKWLEVGPWATVFCLILGLVAVGIHLVRLAQRMLVD